MKKNRFLKFFKWIHKWISLIITVFVLCWALSGVILNHRATFSSLDINRSVLAREYQYSNWNNASLKSSCVIGKDSLLIYGNVGIWLTNDEYDNFQDFNIGFPSGIDHRKTFKVFKSQNGSLLAGTLFGLYKYDHVQNEWNRIFNTDAHDKRIVGICQAKDSIYIMSRSNIFCSFDGDKLNFKKRYVSAPVDYDYKIGLFKTLWVIHSGEIYGQIGKLIVDLIAIVFIFLTITGLIYFFAPGIIKRRKRKNKNNAKIKKLNKVSIKWHNKIGVWILIFLIITSLTGMFLRPPLLIAIANSRVDKIPFTTLDNQNPWYDRFRDLLYDEELDRFLIGTVEGVYISDDQFQSKLRKPQIQVPVSVMGINVFEKLNKGEYLIGSFLGLYRWIPDYNYAQNYITKSTNIYIDPSGPPLGDYMSAGYIEKENGEQYHVDYNYGLMPLNKHSKGFKLPQEIIRESPMSLWNFALEVHTARFFKFLFGDFYILVVPLLGLFVLTILITGLLVWLRRFI